MGEVRKRLLCFEYINNRSLDKHLSGMTLKLRTILVYYSLYCMHFFPSYHYLIIKDSF